MTILLDKVYTYMRTKEITHKIMSSIKSKDTRPELLLRRELWHRGLRYRIHDNSLPGKPDIVFSRVKLVVFCDGDFWHGHNWALRGIDSLDEELSCYSEYWKNKILQNTKRDVINTQLLEENGWRVIRIWESEIKVNVSSCADKVQAVYFACDCKIKEGIEAT